MKQKISVDNLRSSYYEQYRNELNGIWRNSQFLWAFDSILFGGYGFLISKSIDLLSDKPKLYICNEISLFLCFLGLCITALWIAMAKSSKTWQEWYEEKIRRLEHDRTYFTFPRSYAMGGTTNRVENLDDKLHTRNSGSYSTGKLNILIAQTIWVLWAFLYAIHLLCVPVFLLINFSFLVGLILLPVLYFIFIRVLKGIAKRSYLRNEDYGEEFIFETYLRIEKAEEALNNVFYVTSSDSKKNLLDYFLNEYRALSFDLYHILQSSGDVYDYDEWLSSDYEKLFAEFKREYISSSIRKDELFLNRYKIQIHEVYSRYKAILEREYNV